MRRRKLEVVLFMKICKQLTSNFMTVYIGACVMKKYFFVDFTTMNDAV